MEMRRPFFNFTLSDYQLSEPNQTKEQNQLNYLASNGIQVKESTSDITKTTFLSNIAAVRAALRKDREMFANTDILNGRQVLTKRISKTQQNIIDGNDENDVDVSNENIEKRLTLNPNSLSFRCAYTNDLIRSKTPSLQSFHESLEKNAINRTNSSPSLHESGNVTPFEDKDALYPYDLNATEELNYVSNLNIIMLLGLFVGLLISKALQYLQLYFRWFLCQILQLRNAFLGTTTFWEFLNLEDNTKIRVRTKLLLMPIIGACSLLYGLISILNFSIRFLLTAAPNKVCQAARLMAQDVMLPSSYNVFCNIWPQLHPL
uniref:Uncharacterized protein n=1 Tax=Glossina brevipalpis TaxID=37001 RepID=A0A1A9X475_9MUSC